MFLLGTMSSGNVHMGVVALYLPGKEGNYRGSILCGDVTSRLALIIPLQQLFVSLTKH